jgi:hypothetical protein
MKRQREESPERVRKEMKLDMSLFTLSDDAFSNVLDFLQAGEVLMLALTNKQAHTVVTTVLKERTPHTVRKWTLINSLRNTLEIKTTEDIAALETYTTEHELNCKVVFTDTPDESVFMPFLKSISKKKEGEITLPSIEWSYERSEPHSDGNYEVHEIAEREFPVTVGHHVKALKLELHAKPFPYIYKLLSNFVNIEELVVYMEYDEGWTPPEKDKNDDDEEEEESMEDGATVTMPQFFKLKKLHVSLLEANDDFLATILQLSPNVEELTYYFDEHVTDEIIKVIARSKTLKKFACQVIGDGDLCSEFTDAGIQEFVQNTNLEELHIRSCGGISGELFKTIGYWGQNLKSLTVSRYIGDMEFVDEAEEIQFGGEPLEKLVSLEIDGNFANLSNEEFVQSIIDTIPNLKRFISKGIALPIAPLLENYKFEVLKFSGDDVADLVPGLLQQTELRDLHASHFPLTIEDLQKVVYPKLTKFFTYDVLKRDYLEALCKAFPNLCELDMMSVSHDDTTRDEFFANPTNWPNMRSLQFGKGVPSRPYVMTKDKECKLSYRPPRKDDLYNNPVEPTRENFIRNWLFASYKKDIEQSFGANNTDGMYSF